MAADAWINSVILLVQHSYSSHHYCQAPSCLECTTCQVKLLMNITNHTLECCGELRPRWKLCMECNCCLFWESHSLTSRPLGDFSFTRIPSSLISSVWIITKATILHAFINVDEGVPRGIQKKKSNCQIWLSSSESKRSMRGSLLQMAYLRFRSWGMRICYYVCK